MAKGDGKEFGVGAKTIDIGIEEVRLPGVMATPPVQAPVQVKLSALTIATPYVQMTRTPDGMVLPAFTTTAPAEATTKTATSASSRALPTVRFKSLLSAFLCSP